LVELVELIELVELGIRELDFGSKDQVTQTFFGEDYILI
jgi:hypothetical protein